MIKRTGIWTVIAMLALAVACAPGEGTGESGGTTEPEAMPSEAPAGLPAAAVMIAHKVSDYDTWKTAFDEHMQARKDASCLGHTLKRGIDDPSMVYVYCMATDAAKLQAFLASDDLADAMKTAGVEGEPSLTVMKPVSRDLVDGKMLPGIIVIHPVEEYATWRVAYDEFDEHRRGVGIVGHAVSQNINNPNHLVIHHQANDVDTLRAFVDSQELKDTMEGAGVVGKPDIHFVQIVEFADY